MVSTAHSYAALQRRLNGIQAATREQRRHFCGYSSIDIASRLVQRYAELSVFEFTRLSAEMYRNTGTHPADEDTLNCGGLLIHSDKKVSLTLKKFLTLLAEFLALWGASLLSILFSLNICRVSRPLTLLYGVGQQDLLADGTDARFLDFCRNGHVPPLVAARNIVIQAVGTMHSTEPTGVRYGRMPLLTALRWTGLGFQAWIHALAQHLYAAVSFASSVCLSPSLMLLGRDAASHGVVAGLNRASCLSDVIITNSNYFGQPLWMWALPGRTYACHLVWYSQNNYPISYVDEAEAVPIPNLSYVRADIQWVWSDGFRDFLKGICPTCKYKVIPPVVWQLQSKRVGNSIRRKRIALFDVTPVSHSTEIKLGLIRNFYNEINITRFIRDVIDATQEIYLLSGVQIEVILKHKRNHHSNFHCSEYIRVISELETNGLITLLEPTTNIFDIINTSDVVVAAPYSSPVYIGYHMDKVAFWYDPTETLDWKLGAREVMLVQGKKQLVSQLTKVFL